MYGYKGTRQTSLPDSLLWCHRSSHGIISPEPKIMESCFFFYDP